MAHPRQITARTVVNACTSLTGWSASSGTATLAVCPDDKYDGTTPYISMVSGVNTANVIDLTLAQTLSGRVQVLIWMDELDSGYVGVGNNQYVTLTLYASLEAGFTNYYFRGQTLRPGFNLVTMSRQTAMDASGNEETTWRTSGSPSWASNIVRFRIRTEPIADTNVKLRIMGVWDGGYNKPAVIFGFDDNIDDVYDEAYPVMSPLGFKGTAYIISSLVDTAGYCTLAELQTMYDAGWDMSNHTDTHQSMEAYTAADAAAELTTCETYLAAQGWTRRNCHKHFAAPFGANLLKAAVDYRQGIEDAGVLTSRCTIERLPGCIDDPLFTNCLIPDGSTETLTNQQNRVRSAIGAGGVVNFLFHRIETPADTALKWTPTNFASLCRWLYPMVQAGVIDVMTWSEYYDQVKDWNPVTG